MVLTTSFPEKDYRGGEIVHHSAPSLEMSPKYTSEIHHKKYTTKKTKRHKDKKIKRQKLPSRDITKIHLPEIISMQNETVFFLKE